METKRVSDRYKISAPTIIIDGNLTVTGSTTNVETVNSFIKDNVIVLNQGETGNGVTGGTAGFEVNRGNLDNASLLFNETDDAWEVKFENNFAIFRSADPLNDNDVATKNYVDTTIGNVSPGGPLASIQFNAGTYFDGSADLTWDGADLLINDIAIKQSAINVTVLNNSLEIAANGTGKIYLKSVLKLENKASDPSSESNTNMVYSKTPGNAGTGLYFVNTSASDELVSRSKAILFGLIF